LKQERRGEERRGGKKERKEEGEEGEEGGGSRGRIGHRGVEKGGDIMKDE
jgi:hypothetical protein